jgi:hypothetical protein
MPKKTKQQLKTAFRNNSLTAKDLGEFFEKAIQYRGYYYPTKTAPKPKWAGPWRNDQMAAVADTFPYAQLGLKTGIQMKQT